MGIKVFDEDQGQDVKVFLVAGKQSFDKIENEVNIFELEAVLLEELQNLCDFFLQDFFSGGDDPSFRIVGIFEGLFERPNHISELLFLRW